MPEPGRSARTAGGLSLLDLAALRLVLAVLGGRSISAGAAASHLSVAAASKRISDIEQRLGERIFERHARGVRPTAAGERLARYAREVLALTGALEADLADHAQGIRGNVSLVANASAIVQFLPADLSRFLRAHPDVRVTLSEHSSRAVVDLLLTARADLGIFEANHAAPGVVHAAYRGDELVLIVPRGDPLAGRDAVAFEETLDAEYVSLRQDTAIQERLARAALALGGRLRSRIEVHSFDAVCRMVEAGAGVGIVPSVAAEPFVRLRRLRRVALRDPWARRALVIGWPQQRPPSAGARLLVEALGAGARLTAA